MQVVPRVSLPFARSHSSIIDASRVSSPVSPKKRNQVDKGFYRHFERNASSCRSKFPPILHKRGHTHNDTKSSLFVLAGVGGERTGRSRRSWRLLSDAILSRRSARSDIHSLRSFGRGAISETFEYVTCFVSSSRCKKRWKAIDQCRCDGGDDPVDAGWEGRGR